MSGMVPNPAFALDEVRHPCRCPQTALVAQRFRPALQPALDIPQVFGAKAHFAPCPPRPLQRSQPTLLQLFRPAADRLSVRSCPPGGFCRVNALAQQFGRLKTPLLSIGQAHYFDR